MHLMIAKELELSVFIRIFSLALNSLVQTALLLNFFYELNNAKFLFRRKNSFILVCQKHLKNI